MVSKKEIGFVNALKEKKQRKIEGLFVAEGPKIAGELLDSNYHVHSLYATSEWIKKTKGLAGKGVVEVTETELQKMSSLSTANEVLVVAKIPDHSLKVDELAEKLALVLDNIQDPGNMGTIIRIADWFGIDTIVCSETSVDVYNPKVIQATMGSIVRVKVYTNNLKTFLSTCKKELQSNVFGALLDGRNIYKETLAQKGLILMGNESKGISDELIEYVTHKITIPSFSNSFSKANNLGEAESLNVSVAAAIICSEFRRSVVKM